MNTNVAKNVEDYIAGQPVEKRPMLEQMRSIIRSVVPGVEEVISYTIPVYKYNGNLVGFGGHKIGCSFYTMSTTIPAAIAKEAKDLKYSHSTIHFELGKKLPVTLIKKIIRQRMKQNEERVMKKTHSIKTKK